MTKSWRLLETDEQLARSLAEQLKISPLTARILINRGQTTPELAEKFISPQIADLRDPTEIPDIALGAQRILLARENGEKVSVFGDYDVDGVTGTTILVETLRFLGLDVEYYIPHRYGEGYSLSLDSVQKIAAGGTKLIVTVDCGVSSYEEIEAAKGLGVDVVVTDHHNLPRRLPPAVAVVDPKTIEGDHPSKNLSGAGVAFKMAWMLLRRSGEKDNLFLTSLLDLAALGTVADVVPLTEENRIIAVRGLKLLSERRRTGIRALADRASLKGAIAVDQIYFALAPRLNAAGRLEHASKAVELLLSDDENAARQLADELCQINVRRQDIGGTIKEEVFAQLDEAAVAEKKIIVLAGENWHPGVIGIVASQVVDRFFRPTVLISLEGETGRGSARSCDGVNIFKILDSCRDLFLDFGGHEGAAGFEIETAKIQELKERLVAEVERTVSLEKLQPVVEIDAELDPSALNLALVKELSLLDPHGEGNPAPVFVSRGMQVTEVRQVGAKKKHLKLKIGRGPVVLDVIGFGWGDLRLNVGYNYDVAYELQANEWNGFETVQLSLIDIKEAEK